jgi:glyoxalase-like protein
MARGIDHLVLAVPDPDVAAAELEVSLGIAFTSGGRHPGAGTYNRIAFLGEPFVELIGVEDQLTVETGRIGAAVVRTLRDQPDGGFATFALVDDDLDATVERLQGAGSAIGPVKRGSRLTRDGEVVEWWTATFQELGPDSPPFLIRHARHGSEWSDEAVARRWSSVHPAGCVMSLALLELATADPGAIAARYQSQLGLMSEAVGDDRLVDIGPHAVLLRPMADAESQVTIVLACPGGERRSIARFGVQFELVPPTS